MSKTASDPPAIELADGRALVDASAPAGTIKVEFSGRTVSIDRPSQVPLGLERTGKWTYGQAADACPRPGDPCLRGGDQAGPGSGQGDSLGARHGPGRRERPVAGQQGQDAARVDDRNRATLKDQKLGEQFLQQFSPDRPILADMVAATENESPVTKKLAIFGVKAMGDFSLLTPILYRPGDPSARQSTVAALRWVLSQGPQARKRLREQLDAEFGAELGQVIEKLLVGYNPEEAANKETLTRLVEFLLRAVDQSLVVRELALDNLKAITGRGDLGYNPENPDEKSLNAWKSAVNKEQPKPAPKRKTAG